jgi:hypothetical protein
VIEFEYPSLKIEGLLYGRRITKWQGAFEFVDTKNKMKAKLNLSEGPGFFNRAALPVDCIEGTIMCEDKEICKI